MADVRPEYVIINDTDAPQPSMVCQLVPGVGYCYLDRSGTKPRHDGMRGHEATDVQAFGWAYANDRDGVVRFYRTMREATATYRDGEPRRWQARGGGFEWKRLKRKDVRQLEEIADA